MNLLNYTIKYLYVTLLLVIGLWAVIFYIRMIDEVRDSLDDGLENDKMLVIKKVARDEATISRAGFEEHNYAMKLIKESRALQIKDNYKDTMMYTLNEMDLEPFRVLTTAFKNKNTYYELKVVASTLEQDDLIRTLLYSLIGLYVMILLSILVINNFLLRKIWIPFYHLLKQLKLFRLDKDDHIVTTPTNVNEFIELNETVSRLVDQAVKTYTSQKHFIENAAHELQTPLAISLNRLELLCEEEGLSESSLDVIGKVMTTLQRLSRINRSLLTISKIENKQYGDTETIVLNHQVQALVHEFADFAAIKDVSIHLEEKHELVVTMNRDLCSIMISNLIKNAITHNLTHGGVKIIITNNKLIMENNGKDKVLPAAEIFKRFKKGSSAQNNTGLGLAIVDSISKIYDFEISYIYNGMHRFTISFFG